MMDTTTRRPFPKFRYVPLPLPLILNGRVQDESLGKIGQTRFWLKNKLQEQGVGQFRQVYYCSIDHRGKLYVGRNG